MNISVSSRHASVTRESMRCNVRVQLPAHKTTPLSRSSCVRHIVQSPLHKSQDLPMRHTACNAFDKDGNRASSKTASFQFNPVYAAICGGFAALLLLQNPYIFAALTILTIMPQNSSTTSLNSLVLIFYDSGLFMNFAEAVYCVRLVTWLAIACTLVSFALFA